WICWRNCKIKSARLSNSYLPEKHISKGRQATCWQLVAYRIANALICLDGIEAGAATHYQRGTRVLSGLVRAILLPFGSETGKKYGKEYNYTCNRFHNQVNYLFIITNCRLNI